MWFPRYAGEEEVKKLMDILAKGTKCLETFWYIGRDFHLDTTKNLFEQNKDSLSSISTYPKLGAGDKKLDKLLDSFLELPALNGP